MIKFKGFKLINEQAPDPMAGGMGAPAPMATPPPTTPPPAPMDQSMPETPPEVDSTPEPEDPGEYDWTKDFRAFEDAKNKAEAQAKKKLLDKMNKQLTGKKVTTNASRGYGQPKTDHTIENVKKINVEFWYKEWVVIIQDENDKKYFLTPGVNIKIEQGPEGAEGDAAGDENAPQEPDPASTGEPGEEEPNSQVPPGGDAGGMPPEQSAGEMGPVGGDQQPPADPNAPPPQEPLSVKKKKMAESINNDLKSFLSEFMDKETKNFAPYIKGIKTAINENYGARVYKIKLEIPVNHIKQGTDIRDIQLAAKESMWSSGNLCEQFSRGSVDISRVGKVYIMEFTKQTAWK